MSEACEDRVEGRLDGMLSGSVGSESKVVRVQARMLFMMCRNQLFKAHYQHGGDCNRAVAL